VPARERGDTTRGPRSLETPTRRANRDERKVRAVESRELAAAERAIKTATVVGIERVARSASLATSWEESVTRSGSRTTVSYAAHTCGRGRRPRAKCTAARGCRHERYVSQPSHGRTRDKREEGTGIHSRGSGVLPGGASG
jgi:hypothetical protein